MLITEAYKELNARQHFERPEWGRQSMKWWETVKSICDQAGLKTFLDYGCGKQSLKEALSPFGYTVTGYDPAIPGLDQPPEPHDFVVCTDVLEHIEPECLDAVLADLHRVTRKGCFMVIATRPANRLMVDGSNPHRIVQSREWWMDKLSERFHLAPAQETSDKIFAVMGAPK